MRAKISAMMDGELGAPELNEPMAALREEGEALEAWRTYHLISDALHGPTLLAGGCLARVAARLAQEPALLGPLPADVMPPAGARWFVPSALAAGVAAIALVGWIAFAPPPKDMPPVTPVAPLAQAPQPPKPEVTVAKELAPLPFNAETRDYLLAHQAYSPRNSLQGVAPYVRSVSAEAAPGNP
jgi:sigma-E factor negative regulatory protein RseA